MSRPINKQLISNVTGTTALFLSGSFGLCIAMSRLSERKPYHSLYLYSVNPLKSYNATKENDDKTQKGRAGKKDQS